MVDSTMKRRLFPLGLTLIFAALAFPLAGCGTGTSASGGGADGANDPPELSLDVPKTAQYVAPGDVIEVNMTARDPDGDKIKFRVVNKPKRATLKRLSKTSAKFRWDPLADAVTDQGEPKRLIFVAQDPHGARGEKVHFAHIVASNGRPRFVNQSTYIHDPSSTETISLKIEVSDDDSTEVDISMPRESAPQGATFQKNEPKAGQFRWKPTSKQIQDRMHVVEFVADDGETKPVRFEMTIVLSSGGSGQALGQAQGGCDDQPGIEHEPLSAQFGIEDYPIEAKLTQKAKNTFENFFVLWAQKNPLSFPDIRFSSNQLEVKDSRLKGVINSPVLSDGESKVFYYTLCGMDEDAPSGDPNRVKCVPSTMYHSFIAYGATEPTCIDDRRAKHDFEGAKALPENRYGSYRLCEGKQDVHKVRVTPKKQVDLYVMYPDPNSVRAGLFDGQKNEISGLEKAGCGAGLLHKKIAGLDAPKDFYLALEGQNVPYQVIVLTRQKADSGCLKDGWEPNNEPSKATQVKGSASYTDLSICPKSDLDIFQWGMIEGDSVTVDLSSKSDSKNSVSATLFAPSQANRVGPSGQGVASESTVAGSSPIDHRATESGRYALAVYSEEGAAKYGLSVDKACTDGDQFSPGNHSRSAAALVSMDREYGQLKHCSGRPDWYQHTGFSGTEVTAELTLESGGVSTEGIRFSVFDEQGELIKQASPGQNRRLDLSFTPSSTQQFYYKVSADADIQYSLYILQGN